MLSFPMAGNESFAASTWAKQSGPLSFSLRNRAIRLRIDILKFSLLSDEYLTRFLRWFGALRVFRHESL